MDTLTDSTVKKKIRVFVTWIRSRGPIAISEWVKEQSLLLAQQLAISLRGITVRGFVSAG
jgi:hypothetical protein